jgi:hypothetical protein
MSKQCLQKVEERWRMVEFLHGLEAPEGREQICVCPDASAAHCTTSVTQCAMSRCQMHKKLEGLSNNVSWFQSKRLNSGVFYLSLPTWLWPLTLPEVLQG